MYVFLNRELKINDRASSSAQCLYSRIRKNLLEFVTEMVF